MSELTIEMQSKYKNLVQVLNRMGSALIAMSGGVDSVLLAKVACDLLDTHALAVTADSPSLPRRELNTTLQVASEFGINHRVIQTQEFRDTRYTSNPLNRCYFCKDELFVQLEALQIEGGYEWICYGENMDDGDDYRPGGLAAQQHRVRAPLREAGFGKLDVRTLAKHLGLPIWDKPASACLASRIPYGDEVTIEKLSQVEAAEDYLWSLGFRQMRVRHHGDIARIEVDQSDMIELLASATFINSKLRGIGFKYVVLDLNGYQRGSLNEGIVATLDDL